ncbi:hypothetical protein ACJDT4_02690 [Clostridium neuense]|uniref:Competence protein n=1 Tax=Clostridium neuense TaxID=1728934 RepID=A0ABW8TBJ5_9CLOT
MKQGISYEVTNNTPIFKCSFCKNCTSMEGTNMLGIKRGCCFYFPKYSLVDIKNIIKFKKDFLFNLITKKNVIIHDYFIEVKGTFDKTAYNNFWENHTEDDLLKYGDFDTSLFFKKCFFITPKGCSIDFRLRPHQCNLYLCRKLSKSSKYLRKNYSRERKDYFAYCNYIDITLSQYLKDNLLTLKNNFKQSVNFLEKIKIDNFFFSKLENISYNL